MVDTNHPYCVLELELFEPRPTGGFSPFAGRGRSVLWTTPHPSRVPKVACLSCFQSLIWPPFFLDVIKTNIFREVTSLSKTEVGGFPYFLVGAVECLLHSLVPIKMYHKTTSTLPSTTHTKPCLLLKHRKGSHLCLTSPEAKLFARLQRWFLQ